MLENAYLNIHYVCITSQIGTPRIFIVVMYAIKLYDDLKFVEGAPSDLVHNEYATTFIFKQFRSFFLTLNVVPKLLAGERFDGFVLNFRCCSLKFDIEL